MVILYEIQHFLVIPLVIFFLRPSVLKVLRPEFLVLNLVDREDDKIKRITAEQLLDIFPDLTVVTDMPKYYEVFADNLLNEKGLVLTVSNDPEQLAQRDIAVTSCAIDRTMPLPSRCLVFSPQKPLISTKYTVLWDYSVKVPYKYLALLPDGIEDMYFLSALYTLAGVRSLARLIPASASDGNEIFTSERLIKSLCSVRKSA